MRQDARPQVLSCGNLWGDAVHIDASKSKLIGFDGSYRVDNRSGDYLDKRKSLECGLNMFQAAFITIPTT